MFYLKISIFFAILYVWKINTFTQELAYTTSIIISYGVWNIAERFFPPKSVTDYTSYSFLSQKKRDFLLSPAKLAITIMSIVLFLRRQSFLSPRLSNTLRAFQAIRFSKNFLLLEIIFGKGSFGMVPISVKLLVPHQKKTFETILKGKAGVSYE